MFCLEGAWEGELTSRSSVKECGTLYLGFHGGLRGPRRGGERVLQISDADDGEISLEELASILGTYLTGVMIHLGSCSLLRERPKVLQDFLEAAGAKALAG